MTVAQAAPLTGFTVAVTAARRADELTTMLERRGAAVTAAPAISMVPLADDERLRAATDELLAEPPDLLVATTGIGFRGWLEAAEGWGVAEQLLAALGAGRVISRGPKATGALRAAGLREEWSPPSESSAEVLSHLSGSDLTGQRVAVQLHGATDEWDPNPGLLDGLRDLGAEIVSVPVYRWEQPADRTGLNRIVEGISVAEVDAVTFTSAPAAASLLERAAELGLDGAVAAALRGPVVPYCVGPVTATPLDRVGITSVTPERMRLGALARLVEQDLPTRRPDLAVAGHRLGIRARGAVVDGDWRELTPTSITLLRLLTKEPGTVVSRDDLLTALGGDDPHAVEAAVARLRSGLGHKEIVATVVKRGYRLALDEH
ncbi:uroporphyrinogen-III synthase [Tsukamurella sp. 1534]|uniref:uroporphyrinogen-III synthase n=1 Tax=Tsukamurella sp. 1534 TaxID=1151061 RepID=UPI0002EE7856|nr:uroporphyrinogen-III synthase [Tsukamurella sp. 1534]